MKTLLQRLILLSIILLSSSTLFASHLSSAWTTYKQISGDTFRIEINLVRDCSGVNAPNSLTYGATACGITLSGIASTHSIYDIPMGYLSSQSTCNGGLIPGYQVHTYVDTMVFTSTCDSFNIEWSTCCTPNLSNYPSGGMYTNTEKFVANNSSPQFTDPYNYTLSADTSITHSIGLGVYDPDGDSLVFELTNPPSSDSTSLIPISPYTSANPYPWIVLDTVTGQMEVTPPGVGIYLAYMKVSDYDNNGTLKGYTNRSFLFTFINQASSVYVDPVLDSVTNVNGATFNNNVFTTSTGGTNICFDLTFSDTNVTDTVYLTSNITEALPGAIITYTGTNPLIANICWNYSLATGTHYHFKTTLRDVCSACSGIDTPTEYEFLIKLWGTLPSVVDSANICQGDSVNINAGYADSISWTVISGDPMIVGTNFNCDTCSVITATPSVTTSYQMWGQTLGYTTIDTITIYVENPMINSGLLNDTTICEGDTVQLTCNSGYYYSMWQSVAGDSLVTGQNISSTTSSSIWFSPNDTSSLEFTYDPNGLCEFKDTVTVNILHLPTSLITQNTINLCEDDSAHISINYYGIYQWNLVSGDPIISGTNLECDTCGNAWVSPDSNSSWSITYTALQGCSITDTVSFAHHYLIPSGLPSSASICQGNSIVLSSMSSGYSSWSYVNTTTLIGVNISNVLGTTVSAFPASSDQLVYFNSTGSGCNQFDTIQINVQQLQSSLIPVNAIAICSGDTATITTTANASIQWNTLMGDSIQLGQNFDCDTCPIVTVNPSNSTLYQITNTYFAGCFEMDTIAISVNDSALVYGTALAQAPNISTPFILSNAEITISYYDNGLNNWVVEGTTLTDSNGYYYFYSNYDSVMISCAPDTSQYGTQTPSTMIQTIVYCGTTEASFSYQFSTNVGVNEFSKSNINIYPNPNYGNFTIVVEANSSYEMYSVTGALVATGELIEGENSIQKSLPVGSYLIHVTTNNIKTVQVIVIQ